MSIDLTSDSDTLDTTDNDLSFQADTAEEISHDLAAPDVLLEIQQDVQMDIAPKCQPGEGCFGDPCDENDDCLSSWCVEHMGESVCTDTCQTECPEGWSCQQVSGTAPDTVFVCVSDFAKLCRPCLSMDSCKGAGTEDSCIYYGPQGSFCGGKCEEDVDCPGGYSCLDAETIDGAAVRSCVHDGEECPCTDSAVALGLATACVTSNDFGACPGIRSCTEDGLSDCDAPDATEDICNGLDDNCDGVVDTVPCEDGNDCTMGICNGNEGCGFVGLNDTVCDDGDPCTVSDTCQQGICLATPKDCDDSNLCTDDSCDPETGSCVAENNDLYCDDGDPCTVSDRCTEGACVGEAINCNCETTEDCAPLEDGDLCNGSLYCDTTMLPFQCKVAEESIITCPAPQEGPTGFCLQATCEPGTGSCGFAPANEGFPCDDQDACTTGDTCMEGVCAGGVPANCNDGNPCTNDLCDVSLGCHNENNTDPCNDDDACTVGDVCAEGVCMPGESLSCDDGNVCTDDSCNPAFGCVHTPNSASCDDQNACTESDLCAGGVCLPGSAADCDDENICTNDSCDPTVGCIHAANTAPCDDEDICTLQDVCTEGTCVGSGDLPCDDGNACTDDSCDGLEGCQHVNNTNPCDDANSCTTGDHCVDGECAGQGTLECDDGNPCTKDICLSAGGCNHQDIESACSDNDPCTLNDHCEAGACISGEELDCDDANPCTDDLCNEDGECENGPNTDACSDGNACTDGDHCEAGACVYTDLADCDDSNICTTDSCDPLAGCANTDNTVPCNDEDACTTGDTCSNGTCEGGLAPNCNDGNPCTDDSCASDTGCVNTNNSEACSDGNVCTTGDTCSDGVCAGTGTLECDDGNGCTDDTCSSDTGCVFTNNTAPCDDNDECTPSDTCSGGTCQGTGVTDCGDGNDCTADSCESPTGCVNDVLPDGTPCGPAGECVGGVCEELPSFVLYDDFNDASIDGAKWVVIKNYGGKVVEESGTIKVMGHTGGWTGWGEIYSTERRTCWKFDMTYELMNGGPGCQGWKIYAYDGPGLTAITAMNHLSCSSDNWGDGIGTWKLVLEDDMIKVYKNDVFVREVDAEGLADFHVRVSANNVYGSGNYSEVFWDNVWGTTGACQ